MTPYVLLEFAWRRWQYTITARLPFPREIPKAIACTQNGLSVLGENLVPAKGAVAAALQEPLRDAIAVEQVLASQLSQCILSLESRHADGARFLEVISRADHRQAIHIGLTRCGSFHALVEQKQHLVVIRCNIPVQQVGHL